MKIWQRHVMLVCHSEGFAPEESSACFKGFTLPEVCVALAVLLIGTTAILGAWNFFNCEVADERLRMERFEEALSTMESLITEHRLCVDSAALSRIPGHKYLAWAVVERDGVSLKRLVRCR